VEVVPYVMGGTRALYINKSSIFTLHQLIFGHFLVFGDLSI